MPDDYYRGSAQVDGMTPHRPWRGALVVSVP
jgi:hypothetical protein